MRQMRQALMILLLLIGPHGLSLAQGRAIYVNGSYNGAVEDGSSLRPFKTVTKAIAAAAEGDTIVVQAGEYREAVVVRKRGTILAANGAVTIGARIWGRLANTGFQGKPIKSTLFFAGQPLDGTGSINPNDPYFNGCGPAAKAMGCYSVFPRDSRHLQWVVAANREFALRSIADAGLNVVSMSSWGESWLSQSPINGVIDCDFIADAECGLTCDKSVKPDCKPEPRCFRDANNKKKCRIGWYGIANMQISPMAQDQLFDATVGKPLLIIPFIESRFGFDWDFHDEFPRAADGRLAPGLISQIKDLINRYLKTPRNPQWLEKWARVYDQKGVERYAISIVQASSNVLDPADPEADRKFAAGFGAVAVEVERQTGVKIGFFIDPIARPPVFGFGCEKIPGQEFDPTRLTSLYGAKFRVDPLLTGPRLKEQISILGIQAFKPEGWIDVKEEAGKKVNACFKREWKKDFSRKWFESGIPYLQDVSPGYNAAKLFEKREPLDWGLTKWGYDESWRATLTQLVRDYGKTGMVYNAWNGYCEGLAGMETNEHTPNVTIDWLRALTSLYP